MSFAIGVVGHIDRQEMAEALAEEVDATYLSIDAGKLGPGTNHRRVWSYLATEDTEWSIALEDDAVPVKEFREQLALVLKAAPTPIVSLYLGRLRPPQFQALIANATAEADVTDAHWITSSHLLHAVGVAIRTELVEDMVTKVRYGVPIDQAIGTWARRNGHEIGYAWPSIVDHADIPTVINHPDGKERTPGRVAWMTGTRETWNSQSVGL